MRTIRFVIDNALSLKHTRFMNKLERKRQVQVVAALVEGNSIRSTVRMTGVAKGTVLKLLVDLGAACERYQDATLRNLKCRRIQCDEIWSFCYAKVEESARADAGCCWRRRRVDLDGD